MADYRKLLVWQRAHALAMAIYPATVNFPKEEVYGLVAQIRRSAVSVAANIAEGSGRGTQPELSRFCRIARGSINELEYHLLLAKDLGYLPPEAHRGLARKSSELRRMLTKFIDSVTAAGAKQQS